MTHTAADRPTVAAVPLPYRADHEKGAGGGGSVLVAAEIALALAVPVAGYLTMLAVGVIALVAAMADFWRHNHRPAAAFVVDPGEHAFRTPRVAGGLLMPLACGQLIAALTAFTLGEVRAGRFGWGTHWAVVAGLLLLGAVLAGTGRAIGHGSGVTLRPDGIVADKTNGSLSVPWEALEAWRPVPRGEPGKLRVGYLRPGLVRTTGVVRARDELIFDGADRQFVAAAIHTYVTEPGRRHAIGTAAEHERLLAERVPVPERIEKPRTAREIAGLLAGGSVLFLGGITLDTWLDGRHHWVSVAIHMPSAIGAILLVTGGKAVRAARRERRAARTGLRS